MSELLGKKMALVVIDPQRKFCISRDDWEDARNAAVTRINRLMHMFRQAKAPIIIVEFDGPAVCRPYEGDDGDEYFPGLAVRPGDYVLHKKHMNSFLETDLEKWLNALGTDMILLCGTVSQYCVMSTYFAAMDRKIIPYLAQGATISTLDEIRDGAEKVCKTLAEETVAKHLGVEVPPEGDIPVMVSNTYPAWKSTLLCDIAAHANSGGGHFIIGYPKGVERNRDLANAIMAEAEKELGISVFANPLVFCSQACVDVVVDPANKPVLYGGQKFTAVPSYEY